MPLTRATILAVLIGVGLCGDDVAAQDPATSTVQATAAANPRVKVDVLFAGDLPSLQARHQDEFKLGVKVGLSRKSSGRIAVADMEVTLTSASINAEVLFHENVTMAVVRQVRDEIASTELNVTVDGETYTASSVSAPVVTEGRAPKSPGSDGGDSIDKPTLVLVSAVVGTLLAVLLFALGKRACQREFKRRTAKVDVIEQAARRFSEGPGGNRRFSGNARQMDASRSGDVRQITASFSGSSLGEAGPDTHWRAGLLRSSLADDSPGSQHLGTGDGSPLGGAASIPSSLNAVATRLRPIDASLAASRRPNTEAPDVGVPARSAGGLDDVHNAAALAASPLPPIGVELVPGTSRIVA